MKNLVITDTKLNDQAFKNSIIVDLNNIEFFPCTGGFQCFKREGKCHYNDDMRLITEWTLNCSLIILVTRIQYGCFDIPMKRYLERLIASREPYYSVIHGETVHMGIEQLNKKLIVIAYGEASKEEQTLFQDTVETMCFGKTYSLSTCYFCESEAELENAIKVFGGIDHE